MKRLTDPVTMRRLNGWLTVAWIAMIPISLVTGWVKSVTFVSALSLWALVTGHWSTYQAARVEVAQSEDANVQEVLDVMDASPSIDTEGHKTTRRG